MADFCVVETTNESGVIKQERVSVNETDFSAGYCGLVRIDGLERATMLEELAVRDRQRVSAFLSHAFWSSFTQLFGNCFVDVPECVLALTQLTSLKVRFVSLAFTVCC
jgi:hypothetical protein